MAGVAAPERIATTGIPGTTPEVVDSPATPSSQNALARFEFEMGKGNEGTKILMVEWNTATIDNTDATPKAAQPPQSPQETTALANGDWEVSWEGKKTTILAQREMDASATQRVYFLLPTDVHIPPVVTIAHLKTGQTLVTKPMPAIFAPGLGVDPMRDAGTRGVLHTIWAKKRLSQLQDEIHREMQNNSEGVALEMAIQERQWIISHFGLTDPTATAAAGQTVPQGVPPPTPQSPRSPIGGRLGEKLRGLKLATSPEDLVEGRGTPKTQPHKLYSLSPATSDIAAVVTPPAAHGVSSLNAVVETGAAGSRSDADELFALPMSPRSPEMERSPFSVLQG